MNQVAGMKANAAQLPDLSTCGREPIHIPGSIQPHGLLLVLKEPELAVLQASANTEEFLGIPVEQVLGAPLSTLFRQGEGDTLAQGLRQAKLERTPVYLLNVHLPSGAGTLNAIAHRFEGVLILELEPATSEEPVSFPDLYPLVHTFFAKLRKLSSLEDLAQFAAEETRRLTGFDRVLVYKFDSSWHGRVIGEALGGDYPSYFDLWFPASDIPEQARRLYERNRIRLIANVDYTPVPIVPEVNPITNLPLDLSFAGLRSVSPVHLEYMRNMGLASSMSISILVEDGRLWGLISCHHRCPRKVPFQVRSTCDFLAQALAVQLEANEQRTDYEQRIRLKSFVTRMLGAMAEEDEFIRGLTKCPDDLLEFADASGAAVLYEGRCILLGSCPDEEHVWSLVNWLVEQGREEIFFSDCLPLVVPNGEAYRERASGVLAISISKIYRSYVLWFRPEVVQTVKWGGDPRKPVEEQESGSFRIHPRKSFEIWKETVENRSRPWRQAEIDAA
ncbi:MAG TPA: GAF domain-containing protein, partial [Bryobacteraceae bacterium]